MTSMNERLEALEKAVFGEDDKKYVTQIAVVQDRSTSMRPLIDSTISGFNEYVESLQKDDSDEAYLTLIQFDTFYETVYSNKPIADVPKLDRNSYQVRGMTALYDAVGRAITELPRMGQSGLTRYLVVVMTDGDENSSREFSGKEVKALIEEKEATGDWTFVFLGAGVEKWVGHELGIRDANTFSYARTAPAHAQTYTGMATATSALRSSAGGQSLNFVADMDSPTTTSNSSGSVTLTPISKDDDEDDEGTLVG